MSSKPLSGTHFDKAVQATHLTPLGPMTLLGTDQALLGAWFSDEALRPNLSQVPVQPTHPLLTHAGAELDDYFAGRRHAFSLPLALQGGTPFQNQVWLALCPIAYGMTSSYGQISHQVGRPRAVRAVGAAIGRNPLAIFVPCHRVIGAKGQLTGYAGGLHRKTALLRLEGVL